MNDIRVNRSAADTHHNNEVNQRETGIFCWNHQENHSTENDSLSPAGHSVIVLDGRLARLRPLPCPVYSDRTSFFALFSCLAIGYALKTEDGRGFLMLRSSRSFCISAAENG